MNAKRSEAGRIATPSRPLDTLRQHTSQQPQYTRSCAVCGYPAVYRSCGTCWRWARIGQYLSVAAGLLWVRP